VTSVAGDGSAEALVALVGAGPGDPDLLTLRAEAALAAAGLVVVDRSIVDLAAGFAPRAEVVVAPADAVVVADLLGAAAARGAAPAVRLYRGDPWLHARYADEVAALDARRVPHQSVPGPAAELSVLAVAGIAVHHRPDSVAVTIGPVDALPPAVERGHTLVTRADEPVVALAHLSASGAGNLPAAVVAPGAGAAADRGKVDDLVARSPAAPAVVVVGAVAQ
jgi:siroheme synthase